MKGDRLLDEPLPPERLERALNGTARQTRHVRELRLVKAAVRLEEEVEELRSRRALNGAGVADRSEGLPPEPQPLGRERGDGTEGYVPEVHLGAKLSEKLELLDLLRRLEDQFVGRCSESIDRTQSHLIAPSLS